jgi:hypothetical protein
MNATLTRKKVSGPLSAAEWEIPRTLVRAAEKIFPAFFLVVLSVCLASGCQGLDTTRLPPGRGSTGDPRNAKGGSSSNLSDGGSSGQNVALDPRGPMPPNERISLLTQRLAADEDDKKVLAARLEQVAAQLDEKERALGLANREIKDATAQIVRARNELQNWKKDAAALRDKMGTMEKENRDTLETIIKTLEKTLSERDGPRSADSAAPELLPVPRTQQ